MNDRTRLDAHCHSHASSGPAIAALGAIGCPECFSTPEQVYDQAKARGMDLVTITDHDTIDGAMELVERGFEDFIIGEEVTVHFPEDRCKLHVLVWGLTPELHEQIQGVRDDVYDFAWFLKEQNLAHSFAHPLYIQNGRLTRWHLERCVLLFKNWERINGAHSGLHREVLDRVMSGFTPEEIRRLSLTHKIAPVFDHVKGRTGGSDDHGLLNVGRTWTVAEGRHDEASFLEMIRTSRTDAEGAAGHSSLLAHQFTTVGAHFYDRRMTALASPTRKYIGSKLLRFAGVHRPKPPKSRLAIDALRRRLRRRRSLPIVRALRETIEPVLANHPEIKASLRPEAPDSALSNHEHMARFVDDISVELARSMAKGSLRALGSRDKDAIMDHLISYMVLLGAQAPYIISLFLQNKERPFLREIEHSISKPGEGPLDRPLKVALFTDTLADVNGVSRFIRDIGQRAHEHGCDLRIITSTRLPGCPDEPYIRNFEPVAASTMPRYENLELVLPPLLPMLREVDDFQPDVIHVSTPGSVGTVGLIAAKMVKAPVVGVYHTDFPAYIDRFFDDHSLTSSTYRLMRWFYDPFVHIYARSEGYTETIKTLGVDPKRIRTLTPGVDTDHFRPDRVQSIRAELGIRDDEQILLYAGRVSVEKNTHFIERVWKRLDSTKAHLVVVGDGPDRKRFEKATKGPNVHFVGFKSRDEIADYYAASDLFLFPSTTDTLGQVVMEAQASGLPAIVSNVGGPQEIVTHDLTGVVAPVEDVRDWVVAINDLLADPDRLRDMGEAAHHNMKTRTIERSFQDFWRAHLEARRLHLAEHGVTPRGRTGKTPDITPGVALG